MLHQNELGYVMKCNSCKTLQISLGSMLTTVSTEGYENMKNVINNISLKEVFNENLEGKVLIKTPVDHLFLALTQEELRQAKELFEVSNLMLQTENLLKVI